LTEIRIPCVKPSHIAPTPGHFPDKHGCHVSRKYEIGCDSLTLRFTKDDLRLAKIISQVDNKFIACCITKRNYSNVSVDDRGREPYPDSPILVLVDQHAADERVRVERFLKDLCLGFLHYQDQTDNNSASKYVFSRDLAPSRPVLLTQHEALTISQSQVVQESFRKWGVRFTELSKIISGSDGAPESGSNIGYLQLYVSAIPEVVGDKVRLRPSIVCSVCFYWLDPL
jgi:DNA mismatch repair protein MLH3